MSRMTRSGRRWRMSGTGLRAVAAFGDFVAFAAQRIAQAEPDVRVVFDDEEMFFHRRLLD